MPWPVGNTLAYYSKEYITRVKNIATWTLWSVPEFFYSHSNIRLGSGNVCREKGQLFLM
jgi:hypothetical protein